MGSPAIPSADACRRRGGLSTSLYVDAARGEGHIGALAHCACHCLPSHSRTSAYHAIDDAIKALCISLSLETAVPQCGMER